MTAIGEWNYIATVAAPPSTGQVRLDAASQTAATHIWFDKTTAMSGDASASLMSAKSGQDVSLANKTDPTKAQVYTLTTNPADKGSYVDYPVVWKSTGSGGAFPAQRTTMDIISVPASATVTGMSMASAVGSVTIPTTRSIAVAVDVTPHMRACLGHVEVSGQLIIFDYAYPFAGKNYTNPGLTMRQWYATHAMLGFISSNTSAANLVGRVAVYAFQVADSMIAFEEKERQGYSIPVVGGNRNSQAPKPSTEAPAATQTAEEVQTPTGPSIRTVWPREIIS